jgi:hypothetical protein
MEMKACRMDFHGNEYAIGRCIGTQKTEGFDKVFSARLAKDSLKEMETQIGTVNKES